MDSSKAVKASQFSFDNISLTVENSRAYKPIPKLLNPNGFQPSSLDKSRLAAFPSNNRPIPQTIQEKLRPWKNSPAAPSTSSDKKPLAPNFRYNTKKIPLRMNMPSPLTDKTLVGPHSSLMNARPDGGLDAKQKGFRVRNGTSLAKVFTDSSAITLRATSRCGKDASQRDISVHSVDSDLAPERVRNSDLGRLKITNHNTFRHTLPMLIIHFEGVLGTCLVQAKEEGKESTANTERGKEEVETLQFLIRKGVKSELKSLMEHFLIIIVFPALEKKYKRVAKYMLRNKYCMDGMYYSVKKDKIGDFLVSEDFVLNYNLILNDFKVKIVERKVLLVVPLNVSQKVARKEFMLDNPKAAGDKNSSNRGGGGVKVYDEKQFIHFFPKVKASPSNTKVVCVPNYTLSDKYERPSLLLKSSFAKLGKMLHYMLTEMMTEGLPHYTPHSHSRTPNDPLSLPLTPLNMNNQLNMRNEVESAVLDKNKNEEEGIQQHQDLENQENKKANKMSVGLHALNMKNLVEKLDQVVQKSRTWQRMKQLRQRGEDKEKEVMPEFNLPDMKQKVIEGLQDMQKQKGMIKSNIMSHFLVGDLFARNNYLFRFYEKDEFYSKRVQENIKDMVQVLEEKNSEGNVDCLQTWENKEDILFTPPKKAMSIPTDTGGKLGGCDDETDSINLLHMRKQIKTILLYLEN